MPSPTRYHVGDFEIDTACYAVFRAGRPVSLEPKAVTLLIFLVEHRARVVSKDELTELLWKDTFVTPNALTRLVAQLRRELGDAAQEPRLIQTVHRRGYRFIAAIEDAASTVSATNAFPPVASQSRPAPGKFLAAAAALLVMAALGAAAIGKRVSAPSGAINAALTDSPMQVTASLGLDADPALSPDGRQLAWSSDVSGRSEIYAKPIDGGPERQVTRDGMQNVEPAWSPDGRSIAYRSRLRRGIWVIAAAGGTPRRVSDFGARPAWSADGSHVAFGADATVMAARSQIWRARADGSDLAPLTTAGRPEGAHQLPQWSPDGRFLAFVAGGPGSNTLWIQDLATGRLGRVRDEHGFSGLAFAPAGDTLLWGEISRLSPGRLWRRTIDVATGRLLGPASPIAADIGIASGLAIGGGRLAWVSPRNGTNLWSLALEDGRPAGPPRPLTRTTYRNTFPMFSPDGARIAFQVKRPGSEAEVWTMEASGGEAAPLVPANPRGFFPHWTPGGDRVFAVERTSHGQQFAYLDVRSGRRDAVRAVNKERHPRLSPDGTLVAYHQPVAGTLQVFVAPLGTGTPRQISSGASDVAYPVWSRDGRQLAVEVRNGEDIHVAVMPAIGGRMRMVTSGRGLHWPHSWSPDDRHIAYAGEHNGQWNLYSVAADTGQVLQLTDLGASSGYVRYPAWAPDGRSIVFERAESRGNIWTTRLR